MVRSATPASRWLMLFGGSVKPRGCSGNIAEIETKVSDVRIRADGPGAHAGAAQRWERAAHFRMGK